MKIKLSDLVKMEPKEKQDTLDKFIEEARKSVTQETIDNLKLKIKIAEDKIQMPYKELVKKLQSGEITETFEHVKLIFDIQLLEKLTKNK